MGESDSNGGYIDELTGLAEPSSDLMFTTSQAKLTIEIDELSKIGNSIAVLLLITCLLGLVNGLNFTRHESGLVRRDEFVLICAKMPR